MDRKIVIGLSAIIAILGTAYAAHAASMAVDALRVGSQGVGGVTFFNGTVLNDTTGTGGADNPVTFGDNVRIDGRVWRGATAGAGDGKPFIINDDLEVTGSVSYEGSVKRLEFETAFSSTTAGDVTTTMGTAVFHYKVFEIPGMTVDERPPQVIWYVEATSDQISGNGWPNVAGLRFVGGAGFPQISDGKIYVLFKVVDTGVTTMMIDGDYHLKVIY